MGYTPITGADTALRHELSNDVNGQQDLTAIRKEAEKQLQQAQVKNKERFDRKRKAARHYCIGDLVLIQKQVQSEGESAKLRPKFTGPMVVKQVLENDRYVVADMEDSRRRSKGHYKNIIAVDRMKPWVTSANLSDNDEDLALAEDGIPLSDDSDSEEQEFPRDEEMSGMAD